VTARSERARWLRAIVAYDGTDFCGFQVQRSRRGQRTGSGTPRTVQGALEGALAQILQKPTSLLAAGRTDSGVHAVGQVVAFGADWDRPLADLNRALNAVLPDDVAVLALSPASLGFHPRYDALSRTYCYTIWNHPMRDPLFRRTALWVRRPLNLAAMDEAAQLLLGSHDFATFGTAPRKRRKGDARKGARTAQPTTVRHIVRAAWSQVRGQHLATWQQTLLGEPSMGGGSDELPMSGFTLHGSQWQGLVEFTIEANAFLYRMVRSIVGTLIQVGRGDLTVSEFASAFRGADRALAGPTAAPHGLCLIRVRYAADTAYRADALHREENQ
jgi:tRNA pseudouridine38-40 synthase